MPHLYFLLLFCALTLTAAAQAPAGARLTGQVVDEQQRAVPFATVALLAYPDSASVGQGTATDSAGRFVLGGVGPGQYRVKTLALGYKTALSPVLTVTSATTTLPLGLLVAPAESRLLSEVVVQGERPAVERSLGKTTLNVSSTLFKTAPTALDVLRRAPGVRVDPQGAILLPGNVAPVVYLEGKQVPLTADELHNLASTDIDQVEIQTNATARYDGETRAVITIKLRRDPSQGVQGSAYAAGTLNQLYGGYDLGGSATLKTSRWVLYGQLGYFERNQFLRGRGERAIRDAEGTRRFDNTLFQHFQRQPLSYQLVADYALSPKHTAGIMLRGLASRQLTTTETTTFFQQEDSGGRVREAYQLPGSTSAPARPGNLVLDLNYRGKLGKAGNELSAYADYARYTNDERQDVRSTFARAAENPLRFPAVLLGQFALATRISSLRADYEHTLGTLRLSTGGRLASTSTDNALRYDTLAAGQRVPDQSRSNAFRYQERIAAGYGGLRGTRGRLSFDAALRLEYTHSEGSSITLDQRTKRAYSRWLPSLQLQYKLSEQRSLAFSFSRKLQRPGFSALNPFRLYLGPYQFNEGNPFLLPATTANTELRLLLRDVAITAAYSRGEDVPAQLPAQNAQTGVIRYTWANQDRTDYLSLEATAPVSLTKWWKLQQTAQLYYFRTASEFEGRSFDNRAWSLTLNGQQVFTLPRQLTLELIYEYRAPGASQLYRTRSSGTLGLSLQKTVLKGRGTVLLSAADLLNTYRESFYSQTAGLDVNTLQTRDTQRASARFTYRFGQSTFKRKASITGSAEEEGRAR